MDWKELKSKAITWTDEATKMAKKGIETSKEYAIKTGDWSYERLKQSNFALKDLETYEKLKDEKRFVIFCIRDNDAFTKEFLLLLPVIFTKVWIESGSLRIITEDAETQELRNSLEITQIPSALVKMSDGTIKKLEKEEEIRVLIRDFTFYSKEVTE